MNFDRWEDIKVWGTWNTIWGKWEPDNWKPWWSLSREEREKDLYSGCVVRELPDSLIARNPEAAAALVAAYDIFRARAAAKLETMVCVKAQAGKTVV